VVIAGDAVMTRDHWRERQGHHNSADLALAARSIEQLAALADIVVPGHDNYFVKPPD
jgi:glyoxylase-like metal-dependent hydrolase (beta-lactamase superfamily II)